MGAETSRSAVDPGIDVHLPDQHGELREHPVAVLGLISVGGVLGACARYGLDATFPHRPGEWPWATLSINVAGCLLIGVLMVLVNDLWTGQRLLRPFLGVGVLGGFTTFATAIVDVQQLVGAGAAGAGLAYLMSTVATALIAVIAGFALTRWLLGIMIRHIGGDHENEVR